MKQYATLGELVPVAGSGFEPVVSAVDWHEHVPHPDRLRVAEKLGWLVSVRDEDVTGIIGFSVEAPDAPTVEPPRNLADVRGRIGQAELSWFNTDMTAKGLGSTMANTPSALQPHSLEGRGAIAVRAVSLQHPDTEIHRRDQNDGPWARRRRLGRHAYLMGKAILLDATLGEYRGTELAMHDMEARYSNQQRLVEMPAPPVWQQQQAKAGVAHPVPPRAMLVRGRDYARANTMQTVGHFVLPQ